MATNPPGELHQGKDGEKELFKLVNWLRRAFGAVVPVSTLTDNQVLFSVSGLITQDSRLTFDPATGLFTASAVSSPSLAGPAVIYSDASGRLAADPSYFRYDPTNKRLVLMDGSAYTPAAGSRIYMYQAAGTLDGIFFDGGSGARIYKVGSAGNLTFGNDVGSMLFATGLTRLRINTSGTAEFFYNVYAEGLQGQPTNATTGFIYVGSVAGTPNGNPDNPGAFQGIPICFDRTNKIAYWYDWGIFGVGASWQPWGTACGTGTRTGAKFLRDDGSWQLVSGASVADGDYGDIVVSGGGATWTIDSHVVDGTKFRQSVGLSVVGRSASSTGDVADITASTNGDVFRMAGGVLGWGAIPEASVTNLTSDLAGKVPTTLTLTGTAPVTIDGSSGVAKDLTANRTIALAANGVTDAFLRQGGALSVIGRSANSTGNVADISATAGTGHVLRESGSTVGFGTISYSIITGTPSSLPPSGSAGGDLSGTYPNPNVAAFHETGGPTKLTYGAIPDGAIGYRSSTNFVGDSKVTIVSSQLRVNSGGDQAWYNVDGTNYERVRAYWSANSFLIESGAGGSGTVRDMWLNGTTGDLYLRGKNGSFVMTTDLSVQAGSGNLSLTAGGAFTASGASAQVNASGGTTTIGGSGTLPRMERTDTAITFKTDGLNIASGAAATFNGIVYQTDVLITGTTLIGTAGGFNGIQVKAPTYSTSGAGVTVGIAATLCIEGDPIAAASVTLSNTVGLWNKGSTRLDGNNGFFGTAPQVQQTVTGSRGGNAALASLLTKLATYGLIVDGSSP